MLSVVFGLITLIFMAASIALGAGIRSHSAEEAAWMKQGLPVTARPEPLTLNPRETAVLVVDMQNAFGWVTTTDQYVEALRAGGR
jgi:hypothetical protein